MESPGTHASLYPDPQHRDAADRVLLYLKQHRALGLLFGVSRLRTIRLIDRAKKAPQTYAIKLFNGLIGRRNNRSEALNDVVSC